MNNRILLIETATDVCSVAVSEGNEILSSGHITEARSQASQLAPLIQDTVSRAGMRIQDLAAVAVSSGPGSYTGLRVGVSTAKGICFGAGIPLIGIETLTAIAYGAIRTGAVQEDPEGPMIDARRMEVYTALYESSAQRISDTEAVVLAPDTFSGTLAEYRRAVFTGDGAAKYESMIPEQFRDRCIFLPSRPEAEDFPAYACQTRPWTGCCRHGISRTSPAHG